MPTTETLYALSDEAAALSRQIDSIAAELFDDDPDVVAVATERLEALLAAECDNRAALLTKADAWCWVIENLASRGEARLQQSRRLELLAERDARQAEQMKGSLIAALLRHDPNAVRFDLATHQLSSRRTEAVELAPDIDPASLPEQFQRVKTTATADKAAIKAYLQSGGVVAGASLVQRRSWRIS
jgi:hypothetical protein